MHAPHRGLKARTPRDKALVALLDSLWERYRRRVRYVRMYEELIGGLGAAFRNDHIAFRTIASQSPAAGIFSVSRVFEALGYSAAACYQFPEKHLASIHYRHADPAFPKLFISELKSWELSPSARRIIAKSLRSHRAPIPDGVLAGPAGPLLRAARRHFSERPWRPPQKADVEALNRESQFGAWVLLHGYDVNHFTASVDSHGTAALGDIEKTVDAMRRAGIPMKASIEGARGSRLRQSSTEAAPGAASVMAGSRRAVLPWPYAYFEVAERPARRDPRTGRLERFEGFLGGQAASLFEMTRRPGRP